MFAITLDQEATKLHHAKSIDEAVSELCRILRKSGFARQQNDIYTCDNEDIANLFAVTTALKALPWLPPPSGTFAPSASNNGPASPHS